VGLVYSVDLRDRTLSQGTGFLISPDGLMVTSLHVVLPSYENPENPILVFFLRSSHFGRIVCTDETKDLAILKVPVRAKPYLRIGSFRGLKEGDQVFTLSYPGRGKLMFSEGYVEKVYSGGKVVFILTDAPLSFGSSGGPILNSEGEVVAVATFVILKEGRVRSMGVASDHIRKLLETCPR
jgi:S1-C subfamily serine protease